MLKHGLVVRVPGRDPETFAKIPGFTLSTGLRENVANRLLELMAKSVRARKRTWRTLTVQDAFITACMAAVLESAGARLSGDEMMCCVNVMLAMLPYRDLEKSGLVMKPLRSLTSDENSALKIRKLVAGRLGNSGAA